MNNYFTIFNHFSSFFSFFSFSPPHAFLYHTSYFFASFLIRQYYYFAHSDYSSLRLIVVDASCCRFITNLLSFHANEQFRPPCRYHVRYNWWRGLIRFYFCVKINPFEVGMKRQTRFFFFSFSDQMSFFFDNQQFCVQN